MIGLDSAMRSKLAKRRADGEREKADLFVAHKQNDSPSLVSGREIVSRRIEFDGRYNIGYTQ